MSIELVVPAVGESITEVVLGRWLKQEGDTVSQDEALVELESDKATVELPSPAPGRLVRLLKKSGESAAVGEVIGYLEQVTGTAAKADSSARSEGAAIRGEKAPPTAPPTAPATPVAAIKELTLKPADGSAAQRPTVISTALPAAGQVGPGGGGRTEEAIPMSPLRLKVGERLVAAQQTAALLTTFNEIDMSPVMGLRKDNQEMFQERYQIKLGFMSFFVKGVVDALKQVPQLNAEIRGTDIVYHHYYDIGVAVGTDKGLVVPVIRDADRLSFAEIEQVIADFGQRGRHNKLKLEELRGGTFTISNGGIYGSLLSTPIVNPPQSGILGLHMIEDRPVARNGQVVIRPMMYVALTYDHRIVDGKEAVTFLRRIKDVVENPTRMLLEV